LFSKARCSGVMVRERAHRRHRKVNLILCNCVDISHVVLASAVLQMAG
jgi:hypothetical protein